MDWPSGIRRSLDVPPMTINFRIIVTMSRVFGCHPHSLSPSRKIVVTTKYGKLYSIVWVIAITMAIAFEAQQYGIRENKNIRRNVNRLLVIHRIMIMSAHLTSSLFSVVRAENFENALNQIKNFDEATGSRKKYYVAENIVAAGLLISTWCCVVWIFRPTYYDNDLPRLFYAFALCAFTLEMYKFSFTFVAVLRRFVRLTTIISSGKIDVETTKGIYYQPLKVQNVFILNHWLIDAAENLNKYYDVQIVYWLAYFICEWVIHALQMGRRSPGSNVEPGQIARFGFLLYYPLLICIFSHFTSKRANELGKLLFSYGAASLDTTASSLETLEFGFYLVKNPLRITGLKMFSVDLPLLLTMAEAAATYVVFTLQNASKLYKESALNNETRAE